MVTSIDSPQVFQFGVFELDRRARELRKQGSRIRLQEQPFQVLVLLLERAGEVVTRKELHEKLWPSSVFVDFDHGLNNAIARLREALGDSAAAPHFIETLPRLGYRFIYPLSAPAISADVRPAASEPHSATEAIVPNDKGDVRRRSAFRWTRWQIIAGSTLIVVIALLVRLWQPVGVADGPTAGASSPEVPSVAVLPFVSMSPDPQNEYFADGLTEELANKLSGIRGLKVAAQTSTFHFKGKREPAAAIAQALNVNHLLEGSVRQSGTRVRITAQLIDAASGYHLWSESFDRELTDIFRIQEEIAVSVAEALQVTLAAADDQHLRKHATRDAEAYRLYLIARAQISWVFGRPDWVAVKQSYEQAIARDPEFAAAHAGLAHYYFNRETDDEGLRLGRAAAERAVALDPELSEALGARANFEVRRYFDQGDFSAYARARQDFGRALELDPSNAQASFHYARAVLWNEPELALSLFERTVQLDPVRFSAVGFAAMLMSWRGQHDAARQRVRELYDQHPDKRFHIAIHIATLEKHLGRLDEAVVFLREALPRGDLHPIDLWALYMALGAREAARETLDMGDMGVLGEAARSTMDGRYDEAFETLDRDRSEFPLSRELDVAAARLALVAGHPEQALAILEQRLPDLVAGVEPVNARNVLPALDVVAARMWTDREPSGRELLQQVVGFLDGPSAPRWPLFAFLRARAHALAGEPENAQQALDRAYRQGFRTTWGPDLLRHFCYIDPIEADPAFAGLRKSPQYLTWLERIKADNARQLVRLRARDTEDSTPVAEVEHRR